MMILCRPGSVGSRMPSRKRLRRRLVLANIRMLPKPGSHVRRKLELDSSCMMIRSDVGPRGRALGAAA